MNRMNYARRQKEYIQARVYIRKNKGPRGQELYNEARKMQGLAGLHLLVRLTYETY